MAQALIKALMKALMEAIARKGFHPTRHPRSQTYRDVLPRVRRGGFVLRRGKLSGQRNCPGCVLGVFVLTKRAAAADEAEDSSAVKSNAVATIRQAVRTGAQQQNT